jgi:hypothetical protein
MKTCGRRGNDRFATEGTATAKKNRETAFLGGRRKELKNAVVEICPNAFLRSLLAHA